MILNHLFYFSKKLCKYFMTSSSYLYHKITHQKYILHSLFFVQEYLIFFQKRLNQLSEKIQMNIKKHYHLLRILILHFLKQILNFGLQKIVSKTLLNNKICFHKSIIYNLVSRKLPSKWKKHQINFKMRMNSFNIYRKIHYLGKNFKMKVSQKQVTIANLTYNKIVCNFKKEMKRFLRVFIQIELY